MYETSSIVPVWNKYEPERHWEIWILSSWICWISIDGNPASWREIFFARVRSANQRLGSPLLFCTGACCSRLFDRSASFAQHKIQIIKHKYANTNTQIQICKHKYSNTNTQTQTQNLCDKCKTQMQIYMFSFYLWDLIWEFIWKMVWISSLEVTSSPTQKHQCKRYCRKSGTYPHFPRFKSNLWFHYKYG